MKLKCENTVAILIVLIFSLNSCVQISTLQSAKTLEKDEKNWGIAAAYYTASEGDLFGEEAIGIEGIPVVELFGRQGFSENFDAGLKLSSAANLQIDGKLQLVGNQDDAKFALATGLALEYQYSGFENLVTRQTLPLYLSYHPNEKLAIYTSPKVIHQYVSDENDTFFIGDNLGFKVRINDYLSLAVEGSTYLVFDNKFTSTNKNFFTGGVGVIFDIK